MYPRMLVIFQAQKSEHQVAAGTLSVGPKILGVLTLG